MKERIELKEALGRSSAINRNLLLFFLPTMFYVLIIITSTTDYMLLVPNSGVKLPLLNVEINLFAFYIASPILVLVFHYNLLYNLIIHAKKLHKWYEYQQEDPTLDPFLYNWIYEERKFTFTRSMLMLLIWLAYYFLPFFTLIFLQWRFSDYQNNDMTLLHFFSCMVDALIIFFCWPKLLNYKLLEKELWKLFRTLQNRQALWSQTYTRWEEKYRLIIFGIEEDFAALFHSQNKTQK
ncbi:MAG: hypothetical protein HQK84_00350 [Nitrospinae bacterium]|nr:hypothetical protein [Nitrospinota bacterium]